MKFRQIFRSVYSDRVRHTVSCGYIASSDASFFLFLHYYSSFHALDRSLPFFLTGFRLILVSFLFNFSISCADGVAPSNWFFISAGHMATAFCNVGDVIMTRRDDDDDDDENGFPELWICTIEISLIRLLST